MVNYKHCLDELLLGGCRAPKVETQENKQEANSDHFDPKGKCPLSEYTIAKWEALKNKMPFEDVKDFEEQEKGFISRHRVQRNYG